MGVRGHVEIVGHPADDQVTDSAADDIDVKTFLAQPAHHPHCVGIYETRVYPVLQLSVDVRFLFYCAAFCCAVSEQQSVIPSACKTRLILSRTRRMSICGASGASAAFLTSPSSCASTCSSRNKPRNCAEYRARCGVPGERVRPSGRARTGTPERVLAHSVPRCINPRNTAVL